MRDYLLEQYLKEGRSDAWLESERKKQERYAPYVIGARVRSTQEHDGNDHIVDQIGTIVLNIDSELGIVFDEHVEGHNLSGRCEDGYGYYVDKRKLEVIGDAGKVAQVVEASTIGKRVRCLSNVSGHETEGLEGNIVDYDGLRYGVEFDAFLGSHSCSGKAKKGHGLYIIEEDIEFID